LAPDHAPYLARYAELMMGMRRNAEALTYANRAIEIDPELPGPGVIAGRVYYESGDYAAALEYFEREAKLQPRSGDVFAFLSLLYIGAGEVEKARNAYQTYLSLGGTRDPNFERDAGLAPQ